ncbi:hypothetical protein BCR36DRAFT_409007 [Piromyces finnis]|uniref:F-box domain-containing protein n=1 Tax=Piromyces finnis TaxID=1754191 RepID=A0A1Y1VL60_9FUNG|nr:hypothetical protein BCR36DRAFT_409007 [Piromyces finnis]|eukprot:ORX58499.1 hypothetical protein BCR36DRAFT_409007 [Piromyces finnis]
MLSPFRFFRTRPDDRIRVGEDDTNYENLLNTAAISDAEDEETNEYNNTNSNVNDTSNNTNTTSTSNQLISNELSTIQDANNNTNTTNLNDIFGDFSHFNNMNQNQQTSLNSNNATKDNSLNDNSINLFSNMDNNNLYGHITNNNKRVGSTGDINRLSKNPYSPHNPKFQDNKLYSSESKIFSKTDDTIDLLSFNFPPTTTSSSVKPTQNNNNDIFGDFSNAFDNKPLTFNNISNNNGNKKESFITDDSTKKDNNSNDKSVENVVNEQVTNINEDDNDLFGDFNSHNINTDDNNLFDDFTPVISDNKEENNNFFNTDFSAFTSVNNSTLSTSENQSLDTNSKENSLNVAEFDVFNFNSPSSTSRQPVDYDFFSNYHPKTTKKLNNKISYDSTTDTITDDEDLLFSPIIEPSKINKSSSNTNNVKNTITESKNNNNKDNNNNININASINTNSNKPISTMDNKNNKDENSQKSSIETEIPALAIPPLNEINNNKANVPKDKSDVPEKKTVQTPIKLKNSEKIKNDHISSNDTKIKLAQDKDIKSVVPSPTTKTTPKLDNILNLPPDIILHILSFVSLEDLPTVAQLCRRFKLLVYNDILYEQKLRILELEYISTEKWISMNKTDTQTNQEQYKQMATELKNSPGGNFLPDLNSPYFSNGYTTSMMRINELNSYLQPNKEDSSTNEDKNKLNYSKVSKSMNNLSDKKKKKDSLPSYTIDSSFNIFAKEEEYGNKNNNSFYKSGSNDSVDILNIENHYEDDEKEKEQKEDSVAGEKQSELKVNTATTVSNSEKDDEKIKKEKKISLQAKLQMSFMKTPREVFKKECKELLRYYLDFKHPIPYKYLIFEDFTEIQDIAIILRRLVKFHKGKFVSDWQIIQDNLNTTVADFEELLQSEFEENYTELDLENLANISKAYQELNGGAPITQTYLSKCPIFYDPKFNIASLSIYKNNMSDPSLSSTNLKSEGITLESDEKIPEPVSPLDEGNDLIVQYTSFINRLISAIREQYYQIKAIFTYESDALFLFLQKVVEEIISDYLNTTVEYARRLDSSVYVTLLSTFIQTTMNIVDVISNWDKEYELEHPHQGSKFSYQAVVGEFQSIMEPFTQFYVQDEVKILEKQYQEEIDKWKQERENRKKTNTGFLDGDVESYKRNVMKTFKSVLLAPAVMTKNLMGKNKNKENKEKQVHLDDNTMTDSLSLELSLNLIHMNKEALKRCQLIMEIMNEDVGKCSQKLFIVLLKYLDKEHIAPSFQLATKQLATNDNHGTQNIINSLVTFFELIHIADLIQQMVHVYYMEDISSYVDENDFMSDIIVEKKQFERHLDDLVAQGMDKSIQVLVDNIEYTLINELPLDAYNIQSNHQVMDLKPTKACFKVVEFLSYHSKMITGVTDKNTINVLYEEISIRLFNIFVKNLKRMQINLLGAGQLICDLNKYCEWASTLRNPATSKIFSVLKEVGNLFIVDTAQDLKRIVLDTDRYGGYLRRDDIDDLLKCRTDYKDIQYVIETKDCIIQ